MSQTINYTLHRRRLLKWIEKSLIGPGREVSNESDQYTLQRNLPTNLFPTGILFPVCHDSGIDHSVVDEDEDEYSSDGESEPEKSIAVAKSRFVAPSSAGFSFFVSADVELYLDPWAVCYEKGEGKTVTWKRKPFESHDDSDPLDFTPPAACSVSERVIWGGRAKLHLLWRNHDSDGQIGYIVTVSIANLQEQIDSGSGREIREDQAIKSLYEVELRCQILQGEVFSYPRKPLSLLDEEEQELGLQYAHHKLYAIGHGVAVDWKEEEGSVLELSTRFLPRVEVPTVTHQVDEIDDEVLSLEWLAAGQGNENLLIDRLNDFVTAYDDWRRSQSKQTEDLPATEQHVSERILGRVEIAAKRMRDGINLLQRDQDALEAFSLANRAMHMQMVQSDKIANKDRSPHRWRPFQIAFLLLTMESVVDQDSDFRDVVDLIWFPTGGGKTEAYLGVIAFQIIYRRLTNSVSGGGTSVIMRYTLRLLTQQQFERASKLICALELLRRESQYLGSEPITAGMWVGAATSPNQFSNSHSKSGALEILAEATGTTPPRKLVITSCPWCGGSLWHSEQDHGYSASHNHFSIRCINQECQFSSADLPLNIVDEALYQTPPTLLFATVDKFARLAWEERASVFFGANSSGRNLPPELIVQDEMHLISGALGSIVGLYEAGVDTVLIKNGAYPKYIASTATIRNAKQQIKGLYGKEHATFPPPGPTADDSFFTRTIPIEKKPGRMYVGYLASLMKKSDAFSSLAAALQAAPIGLFAEDKEQRDELMDCWWTLLVYHGSLRGVGDSQNALQFDVAKRMEQLLFYHHLEKVGDQSTPTTPEEWKEHDYGPMIKSNQLIDRLTKLSSEQLTSKKSVEENAYTFSRLEECEGNPAALDVALATNMISVGLDVGRLALMIINGQPLTTAEYIQSSSRVGRSEVPGIIFANYYRSQARSLSHYENFRPYHESFYRYVEPTSVTPYTRQARKRALHAALVIVVRHSRHLGLLENESPGNFDKDSQDLQEVIELFRNRCNSAISDPIQRDSMSRNIDELMDEWHAKAEQCNQERERLIYQGDKKNRSGRRLLYAHDDKITGLWVTLNSMRNVEDNALSTPGGVFDPPNCLQAD